VNPLLFQYCQKLVLLSEDHSSVLLAKRKGEQDYDGVFTFVGGKLEVSDGGLIEGLRREKDEEIGKTARVSVVPNPTHNVYFKKADGHHMILPHYAAVYTGDGVVMNEEYSEYQWVGLDDIDTFEPKIENIPMITRWAVWVLLTAEEGELIAL
jgi:ADP-ribose pyrophosphatase YjhB (NUDIX family)